MNANSTSRFCAAPGTVAVQASTTGRYPGAPGRHRGRPAGRYPGAPGRHRRPQDDASQNTVLGGKKVA